MSDSRQVSNAVRRARRDQVTPARPQDEVLFTDRQGRTYDLEQARELAGRMSARLRQLEEEHIRIQRAAQDAMLGRDRVDGVAIYEQERQKMLAGVKRPTAAQMMRAESAARARAEAYVSAYNSQRAENTQKLLAESRSVQDSMRKVSQNLAAVCAAIEQAERDAYTDPEPEPRRVRSERVTVADDELELERERLELERERLAIEREKVALAARVIEERVNGGGITPSELEGVRAALEAAPVTDIGYDDAEVVDAEVVPIPEDDGDDAEPHRLPTTNRKHASLAFADETEETLP